MTLSYADRVSAPRHVLYGGQYVTEYVYRRPRTPAETARLAEAAAHDPVLGYGCDGDSHRTPAARGVSPWSAEVAPWVISCIRAEVGRLGPWSCGR
ncbi:hypothetical protein [Streptomyces althioticus]|uniref:hypothetical protein n=1 Tax=Streptomyces althioticus TaxID=83380 RepID=UPI0037964C26